MKKILPKFKVCDEIIVVKVYIAKRLLGKTGTVLEVLYEEHFGHPESPYVYLINFGEGDDHWNANHSKLRENKIEDAFFVKAGGKIIFLRLT